MKNQCKIQSLKEEKAAGTFQKVEEEEKRRKKKKKHKSRTAKPVSFMNISSPT